MRLDGTDIRVRSSFEIVLSLSVCLLVLLGYCAGTRQTASAQQQSGVSAGNSPLTTKQVVEKLVGMNLRRAQALHSYHGTRTYRVEYQSSLKTVSAEMVVEVMYLAPATKRFTIRSSTGPKFVIDKVFKKLLQAEEDALSRDMQQSTALSWENYDFTMVGYESTPSQSMYVLAAEPKTRSKFLFRGRVWVDANDFAVVRIEAEPAKNPSFWTKNSEIEQLYEKVDDFWLPKRNYSISFIRLGGRAELTIEYQNYQITAADSVGSARAHEVARSADTSDCRHTSLRLSSEAASCLSPVTSARTQHQLPNRSPVLPARQDAATEGADWQ